LPLPRLFYSILLCLTLAAAVCAQGGTRSPPAVSYLFVSPNTQENLTLDQAIKGLVSADERQLIKEARDLSRCLGLPAQIQPALGNWREGSENSSVTRETTVRSVLRYQAARLGSRWRQKSVLLFRALGTGPHRMYVLRPRGAIGYRRMSAVMEQSGIAFRTLVRDRSGRAVVYVVEMSHDLLRFARQAARAMRASLTVLKGEGEFFGHDNRDESGSIFQREIEGFEGKYPGVRERCR
jgi:hypothetical protein